MRNEQTIIFKITSVDSLVISTTPITQIRRCSLFKQDGITAVSAVDALKAAGETGNRTWSAGHFFNIPGTHDTRIRKDLESYCNEVLKSFKTLNFLDHHFSHCTDHRQAFDRGAHQS